MYIVFEYMSADLKEFIDSFKNAPIPMKLIKEILKQILQGLNYLSFNGVLHRDLKPQNILINYKPDTEDVQVKVADFGMARIYSYYTKKLSQQVGKNKNLILLFNFFSHTIIQSTRNFLRIYRL